MHPAPTVCNGNVTECTVIAAECKSSANYTAQYAPPEVIAAYGTDKTLSPAGPHDIWSLGVTFQQVLAASCQFGPLFLHDAVAIAAVQDPCEQRAALHAAVAADQHTWVCHCQSKHLFTSLHL